MEFLERCVHQVFKPDSTGSTFSYAGNGVGNCSICTYDPENNKNCRKYTPIKLWDVEVKEEN